MDVVELFLRNYWRYERRRAREVPVGREINKYNAQRRHLRDVTTITIAVEEGIMLQWFGFYVMLSPPLFVCRILRENWVKFQ
jgi:hypothetical protein